jgi:uncharacterized membrane protein YdjX (TVP38/TMEM64 family)
MPKNMPKSIRKYLELFVAVLAFVLVPFFIWGDRIDVAIQDYLFLDYPNWVWIVLVVGLLALDVVLPIPASVVCVFASVKLGFLLSTFSIWSGLSCGCILGYMLGNWSTKGLFAPFTDSATYVAKEKGERNFEINHGLIALSRSVPVLAETVAIMAGAIGYPFRWFALVSFLANAGIALTYAVMSNLFQREGNFFTILAASLLLPAISYFIAKLVFPKSFSKLRL